MLVSELPIEVLPQDEFNVAINAIFLNGHISVNLDRICTSCGIHGFVLGARMNECTLLHNVMNNELLNYTLEQYKKC